MLEIKSEEIPENEAPKENTETTEEDTTTVAEAAPEPPPPPTQNEQQNNEGTLNPLNEQENSVDPESKTKHRRYWTPKEEEKFYEIWGRENWRLTRHGKNTIFFAKWSDEMRERFNIDVKPEEVQCKVNQTRAKFRQVKKHLECDKNAVKWKKYDIVEKILKNQYRSKDDEPVPLEALENNRDVSPTEIHNCITQPSSPSSASNMSNIPDQNINLSQSLIADHQLTDEVNMNNVSLSDQNLFCNNSQSGNNFSTELFGSDQLEIKQEIENDLKREGFTELSLTNEQATDGVTTTIATEGTNNNTATEQPAADNQSQLHQHLIQQQALPLPVSHASEITTNTEPIQIHSSNANSLLPQSRVMQNHNNNISATNDSTVNYNNHAIINNNAMQPPKVVALATTPRKRNRSSSISTAVAPISSEALESMYLEEVRKKNVLLVEQGEINRKRLRLEERKVKLMEEFFPKFMNLQQEILQKLENVTKTTTQVTN